MANARTRAFGQLGKMVDVSEVLGFFDRMIAKTPEKTRRNMGRAVTYWKAQSVKHSPVSGTKYGQKQSAKGPSRSGHRGGILRKSMTGFVQAQGGNIVGGIENATDYAIWLLAGTRYIAKGKVMAWREGDEPINTWPAKARGNPRAKLPIIIPYRALALEMFIDGLSSDLTKG